MTVVKKVVLVGIITTILVSTSSVITWCVYVNIRSKVHNVLCQHGTHALTTFGIRVIIQGQYGSIAFDFCILKHYHNDLIPITM